MKIVILIQNFPPKFQGGTEIASSFMAKYLSNHELEIHVVTSTDSLTRNENIENYIIHWINIREIPILSFLFFCWKIFLELFEIKPDIVQVHSILLGIPALFYKKISKTPYIVYGRGSDVYDEKLRENLFLKNIWRNANLIFALTDHMKKQIQKVTLTKIVVIPNGIDLSQTNVVNKKPIVLTKNNEKGLIYVGSLRQIKGVNFLIDSLKILNDHGHNVRLTIIGDGVERENLIQQAISNKMDNKIQFLGSIPHHQIFHYLQMADILVLPSLYEGFPNVILEAMAAGLPIVATDVSGNSEIITREKNGYLVEPNNSNDLADKITLLITNDLLAQSISEINLKEIKNYSWERICDLLERNYRSLI